MGKKAKKVPKITKTMKNKALRHLRAQHDFQTDMRVWLHDMPPMDDDRFWDYLQYFAKEIRSRMSYIPKSPIKSAAHNTILYIKGRFQLYSVFEGWMQAAQFLSAYRKWSGLLSQKCWDMPGVGKGEDSYGDWTDALPLGGREFVEGIINDDIANYKQVDRALDMYSPSLKELIQEGENYIEMFFEDKLIEHFAYTAREEERATEKD